MMDRSAGARFLVQQFSATEIDAALANLQVNGSGVGVSSPWAEAAAMIRRAKGELISFSDTELVALDGHSGAVVVFAYGRPMSIVQRRKTATSDNITFQCLYEGLINDEVIPAWDDSGVEFTSDCLPF